MILVMRRLAALIRVWVSAKGKKRARFCETTLPFSCPFASRWQVPVPSWRRSMVLNLVRWIHRQSRRRMPRMGGRAAVALCLTALLAQAQPPQFKSGVDVVRFDVVVLDKARHPVAGLTEQDFRVTEDGKPLRIAGFEAVTIPVAAPPTSTSNPGAAD